MIPYEKSIIEQLDGETPKEKYDNLVAMQRLLSVIAFPRRGTDEEFLTVFEISEKAANLIDIDKNY